MANYFKGIPNISYDINGTAPNTFQKVTNIMMRPKFKANVIDEISNYYPYHVKDGERPDILSHRIYGSVAFAYLILLFNDIYDPVFDWPLGSREFDSYIVNKYGSVSSAMNTTKYYYQIIRAEVAKTGTSERIPAVKYIIDSTAYAILGENDKTVINAYDWEFELNDEKAQIQLIDPSYIKDIDYEVKRMFMA